MKDKTSTDQIAIRHFWRLCTQHKRLFVFTGLIPIAGVGIGVVIPYLTGKIIGSLAVPGTDVAPYIIALIVVSVVTVVVNLVAFKNFFELQPRVMASLDNEAIDRLLKRGASFHNNRISGKLVSDVSDYAAGFMQLSNAFFIDTVPFLAVVVLGIVLVSVSSPLLGLVLLAMTSLVIASTIRFRRRMKPHRIARQAAGKAMIAHIADTTVNNQTVKTFGTEQHELARHGELASRLLWLRMNDWRAMAKDGAKRLSGLLLFQIAFVAVLTWEVHQNPALLATGIFAFSYTVMLSNRLFQIGNIMRQIEEALLQVAPMTEMLQEDVEIVDDPGAPELDAHSGKVSFQNVSFRYLDASSKDTVFENLNITVAAGEKIGLVGPSGGGKTTLTKLLLRFEDVTSGQIAIDEQDIARVTQASLRQSIAYVSQEPLLFHRSIRENIAYGNVDATDEQVLGAAKKASAHEFITKLPNGYETVVGERGVKLSGGQRQRIAIARAILKEAPILVLDEATSALDSASEKLIQSALTELMKDKTALVIAHRLSTIQKMDRILVLDEGKVIEDGTHKELLAKDGLYAKLWAHQSGGFIEE
ncbi:ABC transporter ATP-binding protein [Candidatus Saccharibacteria bacterium]|nr:MAG: ABC transporter ATP-binding protein [Candidatus Saccharibacteria bacterium]